MRDLTKGSIPAHLFNLAAPIMIGMLFQTLYYLIDLYFVSKLGDAAIAGVSAAGNVQFLVMALTQVLGVGSMALIARATGARNTEDANLLFNQSVLMAGLFGGVTLVGGYALSGGYMRGVGASSASIAAGMDYLHWFMPGLALQFALVVMGSALRGTGIAKPTMVVQMLTVVCNAILAPILIAGWGTGKPMGVAGAGLASTLSITLGVVLMLFYFAREKSFIAFNSQQMRVQFAVWRRILSIGLPPGGEFALMFVYMAVIYTITAQFGAAAQAGFGIGSRVMQAIFLPAMAVAFATAPLAGQNIGANDWPRARKSFYTAAWAGSSIMVVLTLLCQLQPASLVHAFTTDAKVIAVAAVFLQTISWNFVASGLIFTCSGMFQALGTTIPALLSSASRLITFVLPAFWLAHQPNFQLKQLWQLSVLSVALQAALSMCLILRRLKQFPNQVGEKLQ